MNQLNYLDHKVFIALGSNLSGNLDCPASQVIRGLQSIDNIAKTKLIKQSSLYQSAAANLQAFE